MPPADDDVATINSVPVFQKVATLELKFDAYALPLARGDLALGFTVREALLHGFDEITKLSCDHAEEEHDPIFIDGFVT